MGSLLTDTFGNIACGHSTILQWDFMLPLAILVTSVFFRFREAIAVIVF